ncbi:MAG: response regulator [Gemmatimonadaceae bacterium]|nr:response regulator [Gemmatimonadaceae bacterium]
MRRRWLSLDMKFPALMTGIVLLIGAVFMWSAHRAFGSLLRETSGARLASSAALLAGLIRDGVPAARSELMRLAALDDVRHALTGSEDSARVAQTLRTAITRNTDSSLLRIRLVDTSGVVRHTLSLHNAPLAPSWVEGAHRRGELSPMQATFSPVLAINQQAQVEYVIPVHARPEGESLVGYLVQTRAIRGRGAEAVRKLIGTSTMLFGQPDAGVWSDLENVVDGPPTIVATDSVFSFDESPRGSGIGVASPIRGTPWVIWLQLSEEQVLEPVNSFLWRMTPVMLLVAILGATLAWLFSRRISGRVMRLTANVDQMALSHSPIGVRSAAEPDSRDEIERLEDAFRLMSERAQVQQQLEAQLQQSQKLEAVGRLAGGIAHDFNNVLTVITNFGEIIQSDLEPGSDNARDLDQILKAANRAAGLTRQLLAFSRRQILQPVRLDINESVRGASTMLERLLPSRVSIALELDSSISAVMADPVQIEQVLLNLAVNASDAMPNGGKLTIRTMMAELDNVEPDVEDVAQHHVCLVVKDSGIGMDRETATRIFEPFFTTKPIGKGTGLGLASVHGIITQLGGRVWVYSEPGKGTTFKLYLPAVDGEVTPLERGRSRSELPRGNATVLLVEDDPGTRDVTHRLLTRQGYKVVVAKTADDALLQLADGEHDIQLVLTDVMMPGMNGVEFAKRVGLGWPNMPILLMSGYSDTEVIDESDIARYRFLEKPFTSASLLNAVARSIVVVKTDLMRATTNSDDQAS